MPDNNRREVCASPLLYFWSLCVFALPLNFISYDLDRIADHQDKHETTCTWAQPKGGE